jgi:hypothetical protein
MQNQNFLGVVTCNLLCIKMIIDYFWDFSTPFGSQKVLRIFVFPFLQKKPEILLKYLKVKDGARSKE